MKGMATALKNSNSKNYKAITMDLTIPSPSALFAAIIRNGKKRKKKGDVYLSYLQRGMQICSDNPKDQSTLYHLSIPAPVMT